MAVKISDIYNFIDSFAPFDSQCEWDNSGLLLGSMEKETFRIGFALDAETDVIEQAHSSGCDLIVTHHPVIFKPLHSISFDDPSALLIKYGISIICAHTNLDKSDYGVNRVLAEKMGLTDIQRFGSGSDASMCMIGKIDDTSPAELAKLISSRLHAHTEFSESNKNIEKVAVCGGAGGEFMYELAGKVDAFITGEIKHHEFIDSKRLGISVFKAGHYETEYPVIPFLKEKTADKFDIDCILLDQKNPVKYCEG